MREQEAIINTIQVLRLQVEVFTLRLKPAGTGYLHTTIDTLNSRIDELIEEVTAPYWKDEDGDIGRLPGQTRASHLRSIEAALVFDEEDVYDGYLEENERMEAEALSILAEQSRLSKIQDKAAGRSNEDDYEHTDEYYDRERNRKSMDTLSAEALGSRPMEGEDLPITKGLSDRSQFLRTMKQKHGQAVMTTSEMMQEELEPLPINTFE